MDFTMLSPYVSVIYFVPAVSYWKGLWVQGELFYLSADLLHFVHANNGFFPTSPFQSLPRIQWDASIYAGLCTMKSTPSRGSILSYFHPLPWLDKNEWLFSMELATFKSLMGFMRHESRQSNSQSVFPVGRCVVGSCFPVSVSVTYTKISSWGHYSVK